MATAVLVPGERPNKINALMVLGAFAGNETTRQLAPSAAPEASSRCAFASAVGVVTPWSDWRAERAAEVMNTYRDTPMDCADASLVALAEELGTPDVFTLDVRGFSVYRWRKRRAFRIHPSPA